MMPSGQPRAQMPRDVLPSVGAGNFTVERCCLERGSSEVADVGECAAGFLLPPASLQRPAKLVVGRYLVGRVQGHGSLQQYDGFRRFLQPQFGLPR